MNRPISPSDAVHLACPVCREPLRLRGRTLACPRGHAFDFNRHGFADLLPHGHGRSGRTGDTGAMVAARSRFLDRGHYAPLRDAVARQVADRAAARRRQGEGGRPMVIVEAGCGDGYYLCACADAAAGAAPREQGDDGRGAAEAGVACYGFDVSPEALRAAARRCRRCTLFVNDVTRRICLQDGAADCLLNIFAPRNAGEFARVVAPGGLLLVVIPGEGHLEELRPLLPIGMAPDKLEQTLALLDGPFELQGRDSLAWSMALGGEDVADLLRMTPAAWHLPEEGAAAGAAGDAVVPGTVRAAFELLALTRRP
jgi:23S rRNA (guanine745-N1)-methyltransferase